VRFALNHPDLARLRVKSAAVLVKAACFATAISGLYIGDNLSFSAEEKNSHHDETPAPKRWPSRSNDVSTPALLRLYMAKNSSACPRRKTSASLVRLPLDAPA